MRVEDLIRHPGDLPTLLPPSKTDQDVEGRLVELARGKQPNNTPEEELLCPVRALDAWLRKANIRSGPRNGHEDESIHAHNTLSAGSAEVHIFYPFHPLYGSTLQILRKPERGDGAVTVIDRAGKRLKIHLRMLLPDCALVKIDAEVHLGKESPLSLMSLLSPHPLEDPVHVYME